MITENMIDITGADLKLLAGAAYALSGPQGLGLLQFQEGPLPNGVADAIVKVWEDDHLYALYMDYTLGRCVKLTVYKEKDKLFISKDWYDHTDEQLQQLLETIGVKHESI